MIHLATGHNGWFSNPKVGSFDQSVLADDENMVGQVPHALGEPVQMALSPQVGNTFSVVDKEYKRSECFDDESLLQPQASVGEQVGFCESLECKVVDKPLETFRLFPWMVSAGTI